MGELASRFLDPVIERRAGMTMDLVASWETIVGERHAAGCRPLELRWPRRASEPGTLEPAVLELAIEPAHALRITHETDAIVARVNAWFGFGAVERVKVRQMPLDQVAAPSLREDSVKVAAGPASPAVRDVSDPRLRSALARMERGVRGRRAPTAK